MVLSYPQSFGYRPILFCLLENIMATYFRRCRNPLFPVRWVMWEYLLCFGLAFWRFMVWGGGLGVCMRRHTRLGYKHALGVGGLAYLLCYSVGYLITYYRLLVYSLLRREHWLMTAGLSPRWIPVELGKITEELTIPECWDQLVRSHLGGACMPGINLPLFRVALLLVPLLLGVYHECSNPI
jgi:hypothetical protein